MLLVAVDLYGGVDLPGVDVHAVLALLGECHGQRHDIAGDLVTHVFGQLLFVHPVFMQGRHEVRERSRHLELNLQGLRGEDKCVLVGERDQTKQPSGLGGPPLPGGAVRQRNHHRLQILAHDLEFTHGLELHRLPGEILLRRHGVSEDVQQEGGGAGGVHPERHSVPDHRLKHGE